MGNKKEGDVLHEKIIIGHEECKHYKSDNNLKESFNLDCQPRFCSR